MWMHAALSAPGGEAFAAFGIVPLAFAAATFCAIVGVFLWMVRRPRWWGKLICFVGLPWIMFSAMGTLMAQETGSYPMTDAFFANKLALYAPGAAGALLVLIGIVLFVVDPRFSDAPKPAN
jgi:hypothetical protein